VAAARRLKAADAARLTYRDPEFLSRFLRPDGRLKSRRSTGLSKVEQRELARHVGLARELALLPYPPTIRGVRIAGITDARGNALPQRRHRR
jgi:ribosomal protein S18